MSVRKRWPSKMSPRWRDGHASDLERSASVELGAATLERARDAMAGFGSPEPNGPALDLGRIIEGSLHEPAHWRREGGRVRLRTDRGDDEPSPWVEEWDSTEDLLVADTPAARAAAAGLIAEVSQLDPTERRRSSSRSATPASAACASWPRTS